MKDTLCISHRFCGPDVAGNGGYTAGLVAAGLGKAATVTLRAPAPLDTPLVRITSPGRVELRAGDTLVAEGVVPDAALPVEQVPRVEVHRAPPPVLSGPDHAFPRCFVCGPDRDDGLRIMPGVVDRGGDAGVVATPWTPGLDLASDGAAIADEFVWAALDCPSGWACCASPSWVPVPMVLGRISAQLKEPVRAGETYTVVGWRQSVRGRKHRAGSAICRGGHVHAVAEATWIEVDAAAWRAA